MQPEFSLLTSLETALNMVWLVGYNIDAAIEVSYERIAKAMHSLRCVSSALAIGSYVASGFAWDAAQHEMLLTFVPVPAPKDRRTRAAAVWLASLEGLGLFQQLFPAAIGGHASQLALLLDGLRPLALLAIALVRDDRHSHILRRQHAEARVVQVAVPHKPLAEGGLLRRLSSMSGSISSMSGSWWSVLCSDSDVCRVAHIAALTCRAIRRLATAAHVSPPMLHYTLDAVTMICDLAGVVMHTRIEVSSLTPLARETAGWPHIDSPPGTRLASLGARGVGLLRVHRIPHASTYVSVCRCSAFVGC